jgi:transporter family-2 protein
MNPALLATIVVILAGGATALQAPTNARLATAVGSPVNAAFISFAVGTLVLGLAAALMHTRPDVAAARGLPWYAWLGGVYGACFVVAAAWGVPRLGVAMTITLMVGGQLLISLALDHFGALGVPQQPLNLGRVAGVALVLAGVLLVRRS